MSTMHETAERTSVVVEGWTLLDCDLIDETLMITTEERAAAERGATARTKPTGETARDAEMHDVLNFKDGAMIMDSGEQENFDALARQRSPRLAKPLRIE